MPFQRPKPIRSLDKEETGLTPEQILALLDGWNEIDAKVEE